MLRAQAGAPDPPWVHVGSLGHWATSWHQDTQSPPTKTGVKMSLVSSSCVLSFGFKCQRGGMGSRVWASLCPQGSVPTGLLVLGHGR